MKKTLVLFFIIFLVFSLAGCSQESKVDNTTLYTLNIDKEGNGDITNPSGTGNFKYEENSVANITMEPQTGSKFSYWDGEDASEIVEKDYNNWKINMNEDKSIKAVFNREDIYTLDLREDNDTLSLENYSNNENALIVMFSRDDSDINHLIEEISVSDADNNTDGNLSNHLNEKEFSTSNYVKKTESEVVTTSKFRKTEKKQLKNHDELNKISQSIIQEMADQKEFKVGDQEEFIVQYDLDNDLYKTITATLKAKSENTLIWVNNSVSIEDSYINRYLEEFENDIRPIVKKYFGREPKEKDFSILAKYGEATNILFTPLVDAGGYFHSIHLYSKEKYSNSNERKMFFMDSEYADYVDYRIGTLAHEFQHMIYYNERNLNKGFRGYSSWINEGFSCLAEDLVGYGYEQDLSYVKAVESYINNPTQASLIPWGGEYINYGISYLFARYIYDRFGKDIITYVNQSEKGPQESIASFTNLSFKRIFGDWVITLTGEYNDDIYSYSSNISIPKMSISTINSNSSINNIQLKGWVPFIRKVGAGKGNDLNINVQSDSNKFWIKVKRGEI